MKEDNGIISMDDNMLAYELVNIRYNNFIQVHKVEFLEKYLCISLDDDRILSIAYCSDSDYSWILEECSDKNQQEKMQRKFFRCIFGRIASFLAEIAVILQWLWRAVCACR